MPSLSPTMTQVSKEFAVTPVSAVSQETKALSPLQGNITKWRKQPGEAVAPGQILAEVETDKATIEWEAQEEGFMAKHLVPEGTRDIAVGSPVAVLAEEEGDIGALASFVPGGKPEAAAGGFAVEWDARHRHGSAG